jgi:hypothetical protein
MKNEEGGEDEGDVVDDDEVKGEATQQSTDSHR